jgi:hypothetical protein
MKYISCVTRLAALLAVGTSITITSQAQTFLTNGLVAYYPFNGNANDASGNGNNGTVYGATLTTNQFGTPNSAFLFSGTSYITAPLSSTLFGTDFTASVWFNASDINNAWPTLLEEVGNTAFVLGIAGRTSGAYPQNIGDLFAFATHAQANKDWELNPLPLFQPSLNKYYQVVVVRAGTNVMMYVNAQLLATNQIVNPSVEPGSIMYIGCDGDDLNSGWVFHGVLDDVRIYNRALSTNEVAQLYDIESAPPLIISKAVYLQDYSLSVGSNYQVQVSSDLINWTNQGSVFTATSSYWQSTNYWSVANWNSLFFRLKVSP